jgi:hypothetical protein
MGSTRHIAVTTTFMLRRADLPRDLVATRFAAPAALPRGSAWKSLRDLNWMVSTEAGRVLIANGSLEAVREGRPWLIHRAGALNVDSPEFADMWRAWVAGFDDDAMREALSSAPPEALLRQEHLDPAELDDKEVAKLAVGWLSDHLAGQTMDTLDGSKTLYRLADSHGATASMILLPLIRHDGGTVFTHRYTLTGHCEGEDIAIHWRVGVTQAIAHELRNGLRSRSKRVLFLPPEGSFGAPHEVAVLRLSRAKPPFWRARPLALLARENADAVLPEAEAVWKNPSAFLGGRITGADSGAGLMVVFDPSVTVPKGVVRYRGVIHMETCSQFHLFGRMMPPGVIERAPTLTHVGKPLPDRDAACSSLKSLRASGAARHRVAVIHDNGQEALAEAVAAAWMEVAPHASTVLVPLPGVSKPFAPGEAKESEKLFKAEFLAAVRGSKATAAFVLCARPENDWEGTSRKHVVREAMGGTGARLPVQCLDPSAMNKVLPKELWRQFYLDRGVAPAEAKVLGQKAAAAVAKEKTKGAVADADLDAFAAEKKALAARVAAQTCGFKIGNAVLDMLRQLGHGPDLGRAKGAASAPFADVTAVALRRIGHSKDDANANAGHAVLALRQDQGGGLTVWSPDDAGWGESARRPVHLKSGRKPSEDGMRAIDRWMRKLVSNVSRGAERHLLLIDAQDGPSLRKAVLEAARRVDVTPGGSGPGNLAIASVRKVSDCHMVGFASEMAWKASHWKDGEPSLANHALEFGPPSPGIFTVAEDLTRFLLLPDRIGTMPKTKINATRIGGGLGDIADQLTFGYREAAAVHPIELTVLTDGGLPAIDIARFVFGETKTLGILQAAVVPGVEKGADLFTRPYAVHALNKVIDEWCGHDEAGEWVDLDDAGECGDLDEDSESEFVLPVLEKKVGRFIQLGFDFDAMAESVLADS